MFLNVVSYRNNSNLTVDVQQTFPPYLSVEDFPTPNTPLSTEVEFFFLNSFCTEKSANESW